VAIDFKDGSFLAPLFDLPMQFIVPDLLLTNEFLSLDHEQLQRFGLQIRSLDGVQLLEVITLRQQYPQPSVNDLSAYVLAHHLGAVLLTGDGNLRKIALANNVACHGTLWLLDEIVRLQIAIPLDTLNALQEMLNHGSRLPVDECQKRFTRWKKTHLDSV
jgi:hypothetical protein